jgi:hypothetical protein
LAELKLPCRHCCENQITRLIYSKEIEKTILLNSIGSFGGKIGAKKNPPRDGPGRALFQARFIAP